MIDLYNFLIHLSCANRAETKKGENSIMAYLKGLWYDECEV